MKQSHTRQKRWTLTKTTTVLQTKRWTVTLRFKNGHVWTSIKSNEGFRKQGLTSVHDQLTKFERKAVALYLFSEARKNFKNAKDCDININYARVFGSCFD